MEPSSQGMSELRERLPESEIAVATHTTTPLTSTARQRAPSPFIPAEVVREIIRHATDTFPAPYSIHCPSPSTSQSLSQSPHSHFPYSSHASEEDREISRKLHALSMKIKLSVSRVSREWRNVAVEFLFNSIRIHEPRQMPLLWYAFEGDAKRRGEQASKETIAPPGSAAWWIRELWIDLRTVRRRNQTNFPEDLPLFDLLDLLEICPNIVVYRGPGIWSDSYRLVQDDAVLRQILGQPEERGGEAHEMQDSELNAPAIGRRLELCYLFDNQLNAAHYGDLPRPKPQNLTLPCISSLELRNLYFTGEIWMAYDAFRLPNLVHLALDSEGSLHYATTRLVLPSLRSVTFRPLASELLEFGGDHPLVAFLEKHCLALEELTVLEMSYTGYLQRLDQLCPILQTVRIYYQMLPSSTIPSVRNVGLYGLEHGGRDSKSGEDVISNIFKVFPEVTKIQDLSWRSSVIRRRAYTNWKDPDGAKRREFWTQVICAVRKGSESSLSMGSGEHFPVGEVALLDWRGKAVEAVPTMAPESQCATLGPDDQLLDALVSGARCLI
ncbi:hypothetical protein FS837_003657 [Tulasnella sp. UAMH 9824]|nr:hypothetical protein FS837_003657 [Tulasnella sp. UAMH 9824]